MKKILFFLFFSISSLASALDNYLFVQSASNASIAQRNDQYIVTLKKNGQLSYFTDRPKRQSGEIELTEFLAIWRDKTIKDNFAEDPPNAAIVMMDRHNKWHNTIGIISNPKDEGDTITYQIQPIDGKPLPTGKLKHIILFFDDIRWNPGGI